MLKKYIGPKDYYIKVLMIGLPLALSNLLNSCMSIVDGVMVASIGESMVTAVGNARNIITLNDMIEWGIISGITIFGSQFYGAKQNKNMARTFGLCIILTMLNSLTWIIVTFGFGEKVLLFYLNDIEIVKYSLAYLKIFVIALIPGAIAFSISTMFKCCHLTKLTFIVSGIYSALNCVFNYFFIYIMHLGIAGAAYGTLLTMTLDALTYFILMLKIKPEFYADLKTTFSLDVKFIKPVFDKMLPVLINETFFGLGQTLFNKAYGFLGTRAMDAYYVSMEIFNIFTFIIWGYGAAISIIIGTTLGEGKIEQAKKEANYQFSLGVFIGLILGLLMVVFAPSFISLYNVNDPEVYLWTKGLLYVFAFKIFIRTINYVMFSTLKSGGDSKILGLLDSGIVYLVGIPAAFISSLTMVGDIVVVLLICQIEQVVRYFLTIGRYKSGIWANDLTKAVV